jgi:hypothetical protein
MHRIFMLALAPLILAAPSEAQTQNTPLQIFPPAAPALPKGEARVTVSYSASEKLPAEVDAATLLVTQSKAHRAIYEIAGQECKVLLETIASECHIETVNITSNTQPRPAGSGAAETTLFTNGSSAFRIKTKD